MKNLLGLLVVGAVIMFAMQMEDENGVTYYEKMMGKDGLVGNIEKAESAANVYQDATQRRIDAEFGY